MKEEIIKLLEQQLNNITEAQKKISFIYQDQDLSEDGKKRKIDQISSRLAAESETAKTHINSIIDEKINALDQKEKEILINRYSDFAYQNRLRVKLENIAGTDLEKIDTELLRHYFAEFDDDPIAIAKIRGIVGGSLTLVSVLPADKRGERQERLANFKNDVWALIRNMSDLSAAGMSSTIAIFKNRIDYLKNQDEDFSIPDSVVAQNMKSSGSFNFGFKHISEG
jgi:hypothetical protein